MTQSTRDRYASWYAGSVLAKESITFSTKKKEARVGPLFIMTKGEAGSAPETGDWVYAGIQPNGKPMKFNRASATIAMSPGKRRT